MAFWKSTGNPSYVIFIHRKSWIDFFFIYSIIVYSANFDGNRKFAAFQNRRDELIFSQNRFSLVMIDRCIQMWIKFRSIFRLPTYNSGPFTLGVKYFFFFFNSNFFLPFLTVTVNHNAITPGSNKYNIVVGTIHRSHGLFRR